MSDGDFGISNEDLYSIISCETLERVNQFKGKKGIAKKLKSDIEKGIPQNDDFQLRKALYGFNAYPEAPSASWFELFLEAFGDIAIIILCIAAAIALTTGIIEEALNIAKGGWIEGVAIIFAVLLVASVGATNDVLKDKQFQALRDSSEKSKMLSVIRGGKRVEISQLELVAGDILMLGTGDEIPGDGLFIPDGESFVKCNVSSFNGESALRLINEEFPFLLSGTSIEIGKCKMLVLSVGARCGYGRLCASLIKDKEEDETPLQVKLEGMVVTIGWIGLGFAIGTFIVLMAYYIDEAVVNIHRTADCTKNISSFFEDIAAKNSSTFTSFLCGASTSHGYEINPQFSASSLVSLLRAFIVGVTIVVVAVPEGLPLAVTVSLAYSVGAMSKDNNLVRHLEACEIMGGATNICSDKTGTLTKNQMTVVGGIFAGHQFDDVKEEIVEKKGKAKIKGAEISGEIKETILGGLLLNLDNAEITTDDKGQEVWKGNPTECALLIFSEYFLGHRRHTEYIEQFQRVMKWPFSSARKRMSSIIKTNNNYRLYTKGASEMVLNLCKYELKGDGNKVKLNKEERKGYQDIINHLAEHEMRVLALAYRDFSKNQDWDSSNDGSEFETEMTLIGLVGIMDPLRDGVTEAVRKCKRAGITVRMVTGDFKLTAKAISKKCGILTDEGIVMEGPEFRTKTDDELKELLKSNATEKLQVLARSSPEDKQRLVTLLMELGEVVSVTGDGTNDAPALRTAHVGLAMNAGTDVAKRAADIVIIDNNFASIVNSVKWGRCVFDNIRKFLQFQLTINVVALGIAFIGAITRAGTPLTAVQLLWVNLIMDTMAALALGTEKPLEELLHRKPYGRNGKLITPIMWRFILGHAVYQITWLCAILYGVDRTTNRHLWLHNTESSWKPGEESILDHPTEHYTMIFNAFVLMQVFNEINARSVTLDWNVFRGITTNWIFIVVIILTIVIQVIIIIVGGLAFMTQNVNGPNWGISFAIGFGELFWGLLLRLVPVPLEEWEKVTVDIA